MHFGKRYRIDRIRQFDGIYYVTRPHNNRVSHMGLSYRPLRFYRSYRLLHRRLNFGIFR